MIRLHAENSLRLLGCLLLLRPWWHANGLGWAVYWNGEPAEFFRTLRDALHAARDLESGR